MSFEPLSKAHPRKISGCGFRMAGKKGLTLAGTDVKHGVNVVPTMSCLDKTLHDYRHGNLTNYKEQGETDSNSFISLPDRIRSDHEDNCQRKQTRA